MGTWSIWHWLVVLLIVVLVFGTKKLRDVGRDLGGAVKGFKDGLREGNAEKSADTQTPQQPTQAVGRTIEGEIKEKSKG